MGAYIQSEQNKGVHIYVLIYLCMLIEIQSRLKGINYFLMRDFHVQIFRAAIIFNFCKLISSQAVEI